MPAVRAFGIPSKQELVLFSDIVVFHPRIGPSKIQDELDFLHERKLIKRVEISELYDVNESNNINDFLITEEIAKSIVSECKLFGGGTSDKDMINLIIHSRIQEIKSTPPGYDYVDSPGSDRMYNELTRLLAATIRYAYSETAIGLIREDRSAKPGYEGYTSKMAFTRPRVDLPEELRKYLPEKLEYSTRMQDIVLRPTLSWKAEPLRGTTKIENMYEIILSRIPIISELSSWDDIALFRENTEIQFAFLKLHKWVKNFTIPELTVDEMREEFNYILAEYIRKLKQHRIKYRIGMLRLITSFAPEAIENSIKFKLKDLFEMPFQLYEKIGSFREAEQSLSGHELSYIVKVQENFGR